MKRKVILIVAISVSLLSCTDAGREKLKSLGNKQRVQLYSGGELVREWISTGKVAYESESDGYYFKDSECSCIVEVSGDVVITTLK